MIDPADFFNILKNNNINFYSGVPDSLLKNFCAYVTENCSKNEHIISANEGNAIGIAAGKNISTGEKTVVYLQNSGLGNIVNPIMSLCHKDVYGIPLVLIIGWRGEPGLKDEPQHNTQGRKTIDFLKAMDIPFLELDKENKRYEKELNSFFKKNENNNHPIAILVRKNTFSKYSIKSIVSKDITSMEMTRGNALRIILDNSPKNNLYIATTGKLGRELYHIRDEENQSHQHDFLNIGSMGHVSSIALGIALGSQNRKIICLDGDGSLLMHMGSMAIIGDLKNNNFGHIVFNNGKHDSVGGQPTVAFDINIPNMAKSLNYNWAKSVSTKENLIKILKELRYLNGPWLLEIIIKAGDIDNLGRPKLTPANSLKLFKKNF